MNYILRQANLEEAQYLSELAIRSKGYWKYTEDFLDKCRPHIKITDNYIKNWPVILLEEESKIIGFYSLKDIDGEHRLDNLWIEPEFIEKGYGSILYRDSIKKAKGLGWEYFRLAGEQGAISFYEKMGARLIGKIQSRLGKDIFLPHMEHKI